MRISTLSDQETIREEIVLGGESMDVFMTLPYEEQLKLYFQNNKFSRDYKTLIRYENTPKFISLERIYKEVKFTGQSFFVKLNKSYKFLYKKETGNIISIYDREKMMKDLCLLTIFDWLKNEYENRHIHPQVLSNSIMRDILSGKLTNAEDIVKRYIKSLKLKNIHWKIYIQYLWSDCSYPVNWLQHSTTDVNMSMEILSRGKEKLDIFNDMVRQALMLSVTVNPKWSLKRMRQEHTRMTQTLMKDELEKKEQTPVYEVPTFNNFDCKLLNTEREVFAEGCDMHHCIYTNYWQKIQNRSYIAFSFTSPERFTLGLKRTSDGFEYDQAYRRYDEPLDRESRDTVKAFLNNPMVKGYLNRMNEIYYNPIKSAFKSSTEDDGSLPF